MGNKTKKIIAVLTLVVLVIIGLSVFSDYSHSNKGTVSLNFILGGQNAFIKFNGKVEEPKSTNGHTYKVASGNVLLNITDAGYRNYSLNFELKRGETITINVNLMPSHKPSATDLNDINITSLSSKSITTLSNLYPASISSTAIYFDSDTWAYLTIDTNKGFGAAYFVLQYDNSLGRWVIVDGPSYDNDNLGNITSYPPAVQQYFESQGYNDDGELN